jgi:hypothetical protein
VDCHAFGREQTELDALAALQPGRLRRIALDAIKPFFDSSLEDRERSSRLEWEDGARTWLEDLPAYTILRDQAETYHESADASVEALKDVVEEGIAQIQSQIDNAPDSPQHNLPEPEEWRPDSENAPAPLFTTNDDYLTATRKLKDSKALVPAEKDGKDAEDEE